MKLLVRILIILLAAVIVAAIAVAVVNATGSTQGGMACFADGEHMGRGREDFQPPADAQRPQGFAVGRSERRGLEGGGFLGFGLAGLAKNLGIIAGIVVMYWLAVKLFGFFRARLKFRMVSH